MAFPGPQNTPRELDLLGIRDIGLDVYQNGLKETFLLRQELNDKSWPQPEGVSSAEQAAFDAAKAALQTALDTTITQLKAIIALVDPSD